MSPREQFEAALDAAPEDTTLRNAFADFLEEQGDDVLAHAQRWMAERRKWPVCILRQRDGSAVGWFWMSAGARFAIPNAYTLPEDIYRELRREALNPTRREAEAALTRTLATLPVSTEKAR